MTCWYLYEFMTGADADIVALEEVAAALGVRKGTAFSETRAPIGSSGHFGRKSTTSAGFVVSDEGSPLG